MLVSIQLNYFPCSLHVVIQKTISLFGIKFVSLCLLYMDRFHSICNNWGTSVYIIHIGVFWCLSVLWHPFRHYLLDILRYVACVFNFFSFMYRLDSYPMYKNCWLKHFVIFFFSFPEVYGLISCMEICLKLMPMGTYWCVCMASNFSKGKETSDVWIMPFWFV